MLLDITVQAAGAMAMDCFTYRPPLSSTALLRPGMRVAVPFGRKDLLLPGYIVAVREDIDATPKQYKRIAKVHERTPCVPEDLLHLAMWISSHYIVPLFKAIDVMLPKTLKSEPAYALQLRQAPTQAFLGLRAADERQRVRAWIEGQKWVVKTTDDPLVQSLVQAGYADVVPVEIKKDPHLYETFYVPVHSDRSILETPELISLLARAPKQREALLDLLVQGPQPAYRLREKYGISTATLRALIVKGLVTKEQRVHQRLPDMSDVFEKSPPRALTTEQVEAVSQIRMVFDEAIKKPMLLHGITGSGKTEVYIEAIRMALQREQTALLLVPEIALTSQLLGRLRGAFGDLVGILHSGMSDGERSDMWQLIHDGTMRVVVGVRSGIYAPLLDLGVIIVDEEHDGSYKQSEPEPRYHARDAAIQRAAICDAVCILGSASPSVSSYQAAMSGAYHYSVMHHRATNALLPTIDVVDMRQERYQSIISEPLALALRQTLARGEQAILFLNRRGYSSYVVCRECGHVLNCPRCDIAMTYHHTQNILKCHYCDRVMEMPHRCPSCGSTHIGLYGAGTETVERAFTQQFPDIAIARLDHDATRNKDAHQHILEDFYTGKTQVLIGTQMVAKGHDFSNVTCIGIMNADSSLHMSDYKAAEMTYQMITQVSGRAGRSDKPGHVVLQTHSPDHPAIRFACQGDAAGFYSYEYEIRKAFGYPPVQRLMRIIVSDPSRQTADTAIQELHAFISALKMEDLTIMGPGAAPIEKIKGRFRYQIILKHAVASCLETVGKSIRTVFVSSRKSKTLRVLVDMDPENTL